MSPVATLGHVLHKFQTSPENLGTFMEQNFFLRLPQIIGNSKANPPIAPIIPVCKTTWWAGVKSGIFPRPIKLSPRVAVWTASSIQDLVNKTKAHD